MASPLDHEPWGKVGDRGGRMTVASENMRGKLNMTPTGRNLLAGSDVEFVFDADPTTKVGTWPDGARGIWISGTDLVIGRYTRVTGWKSVPLT